MRESMLNEGRDFAKYLAKKNPFIKMLAISGSLTNPKYTDHDDVDFFIIANAEKIWPCFFSCVWHGLWYSRRVKRPRTYFCFNYLIDERFVKEEIHTNKLAANEILNLEVISNHKEYRRVLQEKDDVAKFYKTRYKKRLGEKTQKVIKAENKGTIIRIFTPIFRLFAKYFEVKRKKRYEHLGLNKIYSNDRVIRSHIHP